MTRHAGGMPLTHDDLRLAALARQFPIDPPSEPGELLATTGPIQSQTARSTFLGLAARSPGLTHAQMTAAFEDARMLRGSTIRGTVHTMTSEQQRLLDAVTREAMRTFWRRTYALESLTLEEIWSALEAYAWDDWRTPAQLHDHLRTVLDDAGETTALDSLDTHAGRFYAFGHGGFVRRPLRGGWDGQGRPGYRAAEAITGLARMESQEAVRTAVRQHVRHHGPSSRHDIAWWSGLGLRTVDRAIADLESELTPHEGPEGRVYLDLPDAPEPRDLLGVRLLPEFDALLCGYDSKVRDRFIAPAHHENIWSNTNGLMLAPLLVDGRITGYWRMTGSATKRPVEVRWFSRTRRPRKAELEEPLAGVEAALDITVSTLTVSRVP